MGKEEVAGFSIDAEGILWYNERLCVPNIPDLKQLIMEEAHNTLSRFIPEEQKCTKISRKPFGGTE
jgi:hypothetical protein